MARLRQPAVITPELVARVIDAAGESLILVGGQALGFWMDRFGVSMPEGFPYVSRDVDFLSESAAARDHVKRLARALGGRPQFPPHRAPLTPLVGQAVRELGDGSYVSVDVVHRVLGADKAMRARSPEIVREGGCRFRVMHPLDVLKSRVDNLHGIAEKQNDLGRAQLRAAIEVARAFLLDAGASEPVHAARPAMLRYVKFIERLASSDAGRKVALRYGIHAADAIEPYLVANQRFRERGLPQILRLMSASRRKQLGL